MNAVKLTEKDVAVTLNHDELALLLGALNEVCNGVRISDADFQTRLGFTREQAREVLSRIHDLYLKVTSE